MIANARDRAEGAVVIAAASDQQEPGNHRQRQDRPHQNLAIEHVVSATALRGSGFENV